jgi:quinol monooxygenase YgiN
MSTEPIVLVVKMQAKAGAADAMRALLRRTASLSQAEDGCMLYQLLEAVDAPGQFLLVEKWRDRPAFKAHQSSAHLAATFAELAGLQAAPPSFDPWLAVD